MLCDIKLIYAFGDIGLIYGSNGSFCASDIGSDSATLKDHVKRCLNYFLLLRIFLVILTRR